MKVIVTDKYLALISIVVRASSTARRLSCRLHINKNIVVKCKKMFETGTIWEMFTLDWNVAAFSSTLDVYAAAHLMPL